MVKIDVAGTPTISLTGVNPSFGALWLAENLDVDAGVTFTLSNLFTLASGTTTLDGTATVPGYVQTGGTLAGGGSFHITNNYLQSGGAIDGTNITMWITQTSGPLNFSATRVGSANLNAQAIVLGPVGQSGGLGITTDSLQVTAPVSTGLMNLYPKSYATIRLGSADASTLSLLQPDLDNLTVGELQAFALNLEVNNGASTVTLANFDTVQLGSQVSIDSPLALTRSGSALYLNAKKIDINETISAGAGGVFLGQNASNVAYLVGVVGIKALPPNTVELSNAELNRILTTGPVTIGDPYNAHSAGHGPMQVVGPIDLTGITTQLRLVGNGITQAAGATITVPQLAADGYGSISLPEANQVGTFAAKSANGGVSFASAGPLTIGKVETTASPYNFTTTGVIAYAGSPVTITAAGPLSISAAAGQQVAVFGAEVWLNFNGDLSLNAGAGGQAYVEAAVPATIHLDFSNSAGQVKFNGVVATAPTNGLAGPGTPNFIGFWDNGIAAVEGSTLLLTNTGFSFGGISCPGYDNCWTGAVNSLWATGGNWTAGHAPTGSESAKVDVAGTPTISILGVNPSFGSLWLAENLNVDAGVSFILSNLFTLNTGTAMFDGTASVNGYAQTGGTLAGSGVFTVTNNFAQNAGSIGRVGNLNISHNGNLVLGDIATSGVLTAVASGRISGSYLVRGGSVNLVSQTGGVPGGSAIDLDVEVAGALTATVNPGAANGGIYLRNFSASTPATINLTDSASSQKSVAYYQDSDLALNIGHSFNAGSGGIVTGAGGSMTGMATANFVGGPAQLTLIADQNMSLGGGLILPTTHIGLSATGTLNIGNTLDGAHLALSGGVINITAPVTVGGDLAAGAGVMNINGDVNAQNAILAVDTLNIGNVGGTGGIHSSNHLLAIVTGEANITGGYLRTSSGDLELLVDGNLTLGNASYGGQIWAGYGQMSAPFRDASIAVGGNLTLNNGAHINAANDVFIDMLGASSVLALNTGAGGASYILSDVGTGVVGTTYLSFPGRNSGGILIDGVATTSTVLGGSGFYMVSQQTPATASIGGGLEITYGKASADPIVVDPCTSSPDLCKSPSPIDNPVIDLVVADPCATSPDSAECKAQKLNDEDEAKGKFGDEETDANKKSAQKKVAQCM